MIRTIFLLVVFGSCVPVHKVVSDEVLSVAIEEVLEIENLFVKSVQSNRMVTSSVVKKNVHFQGLIRSPFSNIKFYHFRYDGYEPEFYLTIYKNSKIESLNKFFDNSEDSVFSSKFLGKINSFIEADPNFGDDKIVELFNFMIKVYYPSGEVRKINSWNQIPMDKDVIVSERLSGKAVQFQLSMEDNEMVYSGYMLNSLTNILYHVDFRFQPMNKRVRISSKNFGEMGARRITL